MSGPNAPYSNLDYEQAIVQAFDETSDRLRVDAQVSGLDNGKQPVIPSMTTGGHLSVTTAAVGTDWVAFASQTLKQLTVSNQTGAAIEFRQGGAGVGFIVPTGTIFTFFGITNANQIEARRLDLSNSQVEITARWES